MFFCRTGSALNALSREILQRTELPVAVYTYSTRSLHLPLPQFSKDRVFWELIKNNTNVNPCSVRASAATHQFGIFASYRYRLPAITIDRHGLLK